MIKANVAEMETSIRRRLSFKAFFIKGIKNLLFLKAGQ
jgi:hypothetical protein